MTPLSYADQDVEGSFEHALNEIVDAYLDLSEFEHRYQRCAGVRDADEKGGAWGARRSACGTFAENLEREA
jgi:hypothetical protein